MSMRAADTLKLKSGANAIMVDRDEKRIYVIVPEGWEVFAMTSDSGQAFDVIKHGDGPAHEKTDSQSVTIKGRRVHPAPRIEP